MPKRPPSGWTGHVCVQRRRADDPALLLGREDWRDHFDAAPVDIETWRALEAAGFWSGASACADSPIDRYEEAWVEAARVVELGDYVRKFREAGALKPSSGAFLEALQDLAGKARARGVPVIFAF